MRRNSPDSLTGFVNIDKSPDMTSSDVVCIVRGVLSRLIGGKQKAGHLGTLDPQATGVLPVALGKATALFDLLAFKTKRYTAEFVFGRTTDTLDRAGAFLPATGRIPEREEVESVLARFVGDIEQVPPAYSAKSVDGKRAYAYARQGVQLALPARKVRIVSLSLTGGEKGRFMFDVECGGGTYIRALARDIAEALGTVGYMSALRRTRSGSFAIEDAVDIDEFRRAPEEHILPVEYALGGIPSVTVDGEEEKRITNGIPLKGKGVKEGEYCTVYAPDRLLGVGLAGKDGLRLGVRL